MKKEGDSALNRLGHEQQKIYAQDISDKERMLRKKLFLDLYFKYREKDENSFIGQLSLTQRQRLHPLILAVYKIKNRIGGFTHRIISDKRSPTNRPIIFTITHVGKFDIEVVSEVTRDHYYLLSGDYEHLQGIIDARFLAANGVIYFNETVKADRKRATERMIAHLKMGWQFDVLSRRYMESFRKSAGITVLLGNRQCSTTQKCDYRTNCC